MMQFKGVDPTVQLIHTWTWFVNSDDTDYLHHQGLYHYNKNVDVDLSYQTVERYYEKYNILGENHDAQAIKLRKAGGLGILKFEFDPSMCHTRGILIDTPVGFEDKFKKMHQDLQEVFDRPRVVQVDPVTPVVTETPEEDWGDQTGTVVSPKPAKKAQAVIIFIGAANPQMWGQEYMNFQQKIQIEKAHDPVDLWYPEITSHKSVIIKGKQPRGVNRPQVVVPAQWTYRSTREFFTIVGMSQLLQEEYEQQLCAQSVPFKCELRLLNVKAGFNRQYIGLLRLPDGYEYRLGSDDAVNVTFNVGTPTAFEWHGDIIEYPYQFASSTDVTILVNRRFDAEKSGWETSESVESLDLTSIKKHASDTLVMEYCHNGPFNLVTVTPQRSDKTFKAAIAAVKILNPAHRGETGYEEYHNDKWERILLGQDLRTLGEPVNIFEGIPIKKLLKRWGRTLDVDQKNALMYMQHLPLPLAIINGCFGSGKTELDILTTMLLISQGRNVNVFSASSVAADSFVLRLSWELSRLAKRGIILTEKKIVRFYTQTTEARYMRKEIDQVPQHWSIHSVDQ